MRGCCYSSKHRLRWSSYFTLLPRLALPIGPPAPFIVPSSESEAQGQTSNSQSRPYLHRQGEERSSQSEQFSLQPPTLVNEAQNLDTLIQDAAEDDILDCIIQDLDPMQLDAVTQNLDALRVHLVKMSQETSLGDQERSSSFAQVHPSLEQSSDLSGDVDRSAVEESLKENMLHSQPPESFHDELSMKWRTILTQTDSLLATSTRQIAVKVPIPHEEISLSAAAPSEASKSQLSKKGVKRAGDDIVAAPVAHRPRLSAKEGTSRAQGASEQSVYQVAQSGVGSEIATDVDLVSGGHFSEERLVSSLTPLDSLARKLAQEKENMKVKFGKSFTIIDVYWDIFNQDKTFIEMMPQIATIFDASKYDLRTSAFAEKSDFFLPILRRIKYWSALSDYERNNRVIKQHVFQINKGIKRNTFRDMVDAFVFYHLYNATENGHALTEWFHGLSPSADQEELNESLTRIDEYILNILPQEEILPSDLKAYLKSVLLSALIYSIVCENLDFENYDYWADPIVSEEIATLISEQVKKSLQSQDTLKMEESKKQELKEKIKWSRRSSNASDPSMLECQSLEGGVCRERYDLEGGVCRERYDFEKVAHLFESITTLSTTTPYPEGNGTIGSWLPKSMRHVILNCPDEKIKEWYQGIKTMNDLIATFDQNCLRIKESIPEWQQHVFIIMRRYAFWMRGLCPSPRARETYALQKVDRVRLREWADSLGLATYIVSYKELLPLFELLLSHAPQVFETWTSIRDPHLPEVTEQVRRNLTLKFNQEMLLLSVFYTILSENLEFGSNDYYDYTVLSKEDIRTICNQAKNFLESLMVSGKEVSLYLPESVQAKIKEHLQSLSS